jgi:hypothetical protein
MTLNPDKGCTDDVTSNTYIEYACDVRYPEPEEDGEYDTLVYDPTQAQAIITQSVSSACVTLSDSSGCPESARGNSSCACQGTHSNSSYTPIS